MAREPKPKQEPHRKEGDPKIIPPQHHIGLAGHHWVQRIDFDGRPAGSIVLQWQPISRRWCLPDDYARGNDYNVEDFVYLGPCPMPLFDDQRDELEKLFRSMDTEARYARTAHGTFSITPGRWDQIRGFLYPLLK